MELGLFGTSDAWSKRWLSHQPRNPAYYIKDFKSSRSLHAQLVTASKETLTPWKPKSSCLRDHSSITSSNKWVGGVRNWQFLMIYSTVNHQRGVWVGLKKSKTWWRNTWMVPNAEMAQSLSSLQKSEFLKLIISFFHYFWCQNWDQWHKMSGKNTHIYFFYFWFKNKRVWAEKIGKKQKNFKNLKVAGNYPNI